MRQFLTVVNTLTLFGGVLLLALGVWPGFVVGCWVELLLPAIAGLGLAWFACAGRLMFGRNRDRLPATVRRVLFAPAAVLLTLALLVFYVPRRIAFAFCADEFERRAAAVVARAGGRPIREGVDEWVGPYRVTEVATDAAGGVYFVTGTGPDGIGPDAMYYGFARQPNRGGTPFGSAKHWLGRLSGDWCWFRASDDR